MAVDDEHVAVDDEHVALFMSSSCGFAGPISGRSGMGKRFELAIARNSSSERTVLSSQTTAASSSYASDIKRSQYYRESRGQQINDRRVPFRGRDRRFAARDG